MPGLLRVEGAELSPVTLKDWVRLADVYLSLIKSAVQPDDSHKSSLNAKNGRMFLPPLNNLIHPQW
jgi:hypothetical protein